MGIIRAFSGAISGTFADQWKDIITAGPFNEHVAVAPGVQRSANRGRGSNFYGSTGVLTSGSKIYVPENTACFIFDQSGIEGIITESGGYEYQNGQASLLNGSGFRNAIFEQAKERLGYGGISPDSKQIAFVNLREIRGIKFGTKGAQVYNDYFYGTDLEIFAYGSFTIKVTDPVKFIRNFVPPKVVYYTFDNPRVRSQLLAEFLQSFAVALNSLSGTFRISQLPAQSNEIAKTVVADTENAGSWEERFGFKIVRVAIENIEFSADSKELVREYSENKMRAKAYDDVSQKTSNIAAQQQIAAGIKDHGLGDGAGMLLGMSIAQGLSQTAEQQSSVPSFDERIEQLKKLKELVDANILTQEEFDLKKKEIMGL